MRKLPGRSPASRHSVQGLSLIELMVALMLGLLVLGAAIGIFASNRQTFRATENLSRVQETVRMSYEMVARDLREAAGNPCVNNVPIVNVVNGAAGNWWTDLSEWDQAFRGFGAAEALPGGPAFGAAPGNRVVGSEAVQWLSADDNVVTISAHDTAGAQFTLNTADHGFAAGDFAIVCNARQASVFQVSSVAGTAVRHELGAGPGNCTTGLGLPLDCGAGTVFAFAAPNSVVARLNASRWLVAINPAGRPALYQTRLVGGAPQLQEIVEGVVDMQVRYLLDGGIAYVDAAAVGARWADVTAARIELTLESPERVGTDGNELTRQMIQVSSLRNRNP
jgi:type IV pilus assembly protein PilW